jgi:hypothetical protein
LQVEHGEQLGSMSRSTEPLDHFVPGGEVDPGREDAIAI